MLDAIRDVLAEALAKLQAARDSTTPSPNARRCELAPVADGLERMAADGARIGEQNVGQAVVFAK